MGLSSSHEAQRDGMVDCHNLQCMHCGQYYTEVSKYNHYKCGKCMMEELRKLDLEKEHKMGHWYKEDGSPCFKVPYADKKKGLKDTTIVDARKLGLYPSVTEVIKILSKFGLQDWAVDQHLHIVYDNQYLLKNTKEMFFNKVKSKAKVEMEKPSSDGSELHEFLEKHFKNLIDINTLDSNVINLINNVQKWLDVNKLKVVHSEYRIIPKQCGYGGTIDLVCEDINKKIVLVDFKSTEFEKLDKITGKISKKALKPYQDHFMQLCAYLKGYTSNRGRLINLYLDRNNIGEISAYEYSSKEIVKYTRAWELCLDLFKCLKEI